MSNLRVSGQNFFTTILTVGVTESALSFVLESVGDLTSPCYLIFNPTSDTGREVILANGVWSGNTVTVANLGSRGLAGSAAGAQAHGPNTVVRCVPVFQVIDDLHDRVEQHNHLGTGNGVKLSHGSALTGLNADDHTQYLNAARHLEAGAHTSVPHSELAGLGLDDHPHYLNVGRHGALAHNFVDHGALAGLDGDDHAQYLNTLRHDVTARHPRSALGDGLGFGLRPPLLKWTAGDTFIKANYPWARAWRVRVQAGGGGAGGAETTGANEMSGGGGGGAGGYAEAFGLISALPASVPVTVGTGGAGGAGAANGSNGGTSSFGTLASAGGGTGGGFIGKTTAPAVSLAGEGGDGTIGDILLTGGNGHRAVLLNANTGNGAAGGSGGDSPLGGGGGRGERAPEAPSRAPARSFGGGGGGPANGSNDSQNSGGEGFQGVVLLELYA